jgi:D-amino peptidase
MNKKVRLLWIVPILLAFFGESTVGKDVSKVFISVDMEGVSGVVSWEDVSRAGLDYQLFRKLMTQEANAAVEGALEAGATEILVRDSHSTARNILPDLLNPEATLLRDWSGGPMGMMEGIDESFDAVIFIGYHAREGTPNAVLKHTSTGKIDVFLNGQNMPEAGINAAIAGYFNVPVVMVAGDLALVDQVKEFLGDVECVAVKEGVGQAAKMLHPSKAQQMIKRGTREALTDLGRFKPFKLAAPVTMEIRYKDEIDAARYSWFPGAKRSSERAVSFTHDSYLEVLRFYMFVR